MPPNTVAAFLIDMDGVLYHGDHALPGAADFLSAVSKIPSLFVTNNPILSPEHVVRKLSDLGLGEYRPNQVLTSAEATADWLSRQGSGIRYFSVGESGLDQALSRVGTYDADHADYVVVGEGVGLDYESLAIGINLILKRGAKLVATNPDTTVDAVRNGKPWILPGGGALVAPFATATNSRPIVIGKPQPLLYRMALGRLCVVPERCLMVGDRPDTDIAGAAALGMPTALVRTGRFHPGEAWPKEVPPPDYDTRNLKELLEALQNIQINRVRL